MVFRPEVFLSATPVELDGYREVARKTLREIGARVVEHQDYSIAYGPLQGVLYQSIRPCEVVIHLVGRSYGIEPPERTMGDPRRSFAQYEVDVAKASGKTVFSFLTTAETQVAQMPPEDDERISIQREHRSAIERSGGHVQTFRDEEELARQIRALRPRIMVRRRLARLPRPAMGQQFVGRQHLAQIIAEELDAGGIVVLHSPPEPGAESGTGRTALAIEVAWRMHEAGRFPFVFTVPGGLRADLEVALASLARSDALGLVPDEIAGHQLRLDAVREWFRRNENAGKWLLLVDGVDEPVNWLRVQRFLDEIGVGSVLVTSRIQAWPNMRSHALAPWGTEQGRNYILSRAMPGRAHNRTDIAAAERLAENLGRVPLCLEIATAKLLQDRKTPAELLTLLDSMSAARRRSDQPVANTYLAEVLGRTVADLDDFTRLLLRQLACFAPQPVAVPLAAFENRGDTEQVRASIATLQRLALVTVENSGRAISLHRRIRQVLLDDAPAAEHSAALGAALATLDAASRRTGAQSTLLQEALVPHSRVLLGQLEGHPLELHASALSSSLARWLQDIGRPAEAEPLFRRALAIEEKRFGPEHPEIVPRLRDLANVLRLRGKSAQAEPLHRRALQISETAFGKESPEIVSDLYQVAASLRAQHRLQPAEELYQRALRIEESHSGLTHPRVAVALHRLAGLLEVARRWFEAEALYRRAITIDEAAVGPNHPRVIAGLYNLSAVLAVARRGPEAEALLQRAIAHDERTYGPDHVEITPGLRVLADLLDRRGATAEAEALWRRVIAAEESAFGADSLEIAADRLALATLLFNQSRTAEAQPLVESAIPPIIAAGKRLNRKHPYLEPALQLYCEILGDLGMQQEDIANRRLSMLGGVRPKRVHVVV